MRLALLFLAASGLLLAWSFQLSGSGQSADIVSTAPARPAPRTVPAPRVVGGIVTVDTSAPPLFRAATVPAALAGPQPGNAFVLVGLAGDGAARVALLRDQADHHVYSARTGESVRDWTLSEANQHCVVLRKGRQRQSVCLS